MKKQLLAVSLVLAMAFTLSCSSGDDDGNPGGSSGGQTAQPAWNGKDLNLANCTEVYDKAYIVCQQHYYGQECDDITRTEGDFIIATSKVYRCNWGNNVTGVWVPYHNSNGTNEYNAVTINDIFNGGDVSDENPCRSYGIPYTGEYISKECGELDGSAIACVPPRQICN